MLDFFQYLPETLLPPYSLNFVFSFYLKAITHFLFHNSFIVESAQKCT